MNIGLKRNFNIFSKAVPTVRTPYLVGIGVPHRLENPGSATANIDYRSYMPYENLVCVYIIGLFHCSFEHFYHSVLSVSSRFSSPRLPKVYIRL